MDAKLRELERRADNDSQAAIQLAAALKRLIQDQWQAVPCNTRETYAVIGYRHEKCLDCHGMEFLRINVTNLNEYVSRQDRPLMPEPPPSISPPIPPWTPGSLVDQHVQAQTNG